MIFGFRIKCFLHSKMYDYNKIMTILLTVLGNDFFFVLKYQNSLPIYLRPTIC